MSMATYKSACFRYCASWNLWRSLFTQSKETAKTVSMAKTIAIVAIYSLVLASCSAHTQENLSTTIVASDINEYLRMHPELKVVAELKRTAVAQSPSNYSLRYKVGIRFAGEYEFIRTRVRKMRSKGLW